MDAILSFLGEYGYIGLFIASFLAATVLPIGSEALFTALLYATDSDPWTCIWAASTGNFLGALTCYGIGRLGKTEWMEKYLGISKSKLDEWIPRIRNFIYVGCFFSFLPIIGDLMAVAAGYLRTKFWLASICLFAGKFTRYVGWAAISYWAFV